MKRTMWVGLGILLLIGWSAWAGSTNAVFSWHPDRQSMDGDFTLVPLAQALRAVSKATGWRVFIEPKATAMVSTRFKDVPSDEALKLMLDDLSFALLTGKKSTTRLFVFKTGINAATNLLAFEPAARRNRTVTNELVIRLKPGAGKSAAELATSVHGEIVGRIEQASTYRMKFADADLTETARTTLQSDDSAASVDSNYIIERPEPADPAQVGSTQPFNLKAQSSSSSDKVVVGLIDEPVQKLDPGMQSFLLPTLTVAGLNDLADNSGTPTHGTSMAEILLQQLAASSGTAGSSSVKVLPVDVYGGGDSTTSFDVASGIEAAVNGGANIVNLSLGGSGDSQVMHDVIAAAKSQGVLFIAAAGNEPVTSPTYPAAYPEVVAVTALQNDGVLAPYANRGSFVSEGAPGDALIAYGGQAYVVSGTSTSTALVSGAVAGALAQLPGQSPAQVEAKVLSQFNFKAGTPP